MTDELDRLKSALRGATPAADPAAKARAMAAARESFEKIQETAADTRPNPDRPQKAGGFWTGAKDMIYSIGLRPVLYATSCIVVAGLVVVTVKPFEFSRAPLMRLETSSTDALKAPEAAARQTNSAEEARIESKATAADTEAELISPAGKSDSEADDTFAKAAPLPQVAEQVQSLVDRADIAAGAEQGAAPMSSAEMAPPIKIPANGIMRSVPAPDANPIQLIEPQPGDKFTGFKENAVKSVADAPVSTFSIDVDTASYAYVRRSLLNGHVPPADAVRIEEMINYFPYDYAAPNLSEAPFSTSVSVMQTPWNPNTKLVHIGIQGAKPAAENRPPLNLVFLIDTSGSMQSPDKLPLLKQSFRLLLNSLRPDDQVAIVAYAGSAGTVLKPTAASDKNQILDSLKRLNAGGSTAGQAGLQQAYALAEDMAGEGQIGRVILATDGDFNVGISDPERLKSFVEDKRETGVYLSVLGFGDGNYRDDMMQTLAQNGNGTAAYIDTLAEAQKVLIDQVSGALFPIADDVKIQVEFNPAQIAEYRLIGYETRALNREDFNNDKVDAGEIGAGHTVTALYEVTPVGSPALRNDPLRYAGDTATVVANDSPEFGYVKLRYKDPGAARSKLIETPILPQRNDATVEATFAASIAGFGQLLTGATYLMDWGWDEAIELAQSSKGADPFGYRAEAIRLMQLAKSLE
jgi:Ca-activated chloride channel family protein